MAETRSTKWRRENPEKWNEQRAAYREERKRKRNEWYANLPPDKKEAFRKQVRDRYNDPDRREYCKLKSRELGRLRVLRNCGMSLMEAREWIRQQEDKCCICGTDKQLGVDHCHDTMTVRGLLCRNCNVAIGHLRDSVNLVQKALAYLTRHEKKNQDRV